MYGCEACLAGELLEFSDGSLGLALNLESQAIGAVRFMRLASESRPVRRDLSRSDNPSQVANILVGGAYRGRIVSALGTPLDGKGSLGDGASEPRSLESHAPSIMDRRSVHEPFATGVTAVDAILNQTDVLCVYVAVGQKTSTWRR